MSTRYIFGLTTILVIVGGTAYAIKKSKDKKNVEGISITSEQAKAEIDAWKKLKDIDMSEEVSGVDSDGDISPEEMKIHRFKVAREMEELHYRKYAKFEEDEDYEDENENSDEDYEDNSEGMGYFEEVDEEDSEIEEVMYEMREKNLEKGDKTLRFDPDSLDAKKQYIQMELADWNPQEDMHMTLTMLFDFPFKPKNDGDDSLRTNLIEYRSHFFGFGSKWTREVTYADVILHYARAAEYNCDESIRYWVDYFMDFNEIAYHLSSHELDEIIDDLNNHIYINKDMGTFGLFGLTRESMNNAIKIASRNVDKEVTYEIEFNEFLKSCI